MLKNIHNRFDRQWKGMFEGENEKNVDENGNKERSEKR